MVENFEEYTKPMSEDDLKLMDVVIRGLSLRSKTNPIVAKEIIKAVNGSLSKYGVKTKLSEPRLRKIVNHLRVNSLLCVMGGTNGYYVSTDPDEIASNIRSLNDRAKGILAAAKGLEAFLVPKPLAVPPSKEQPTLFVV
jgi:hypothetical protein